MDIYEKLKAKWEGLDAIQETCYYKLNNQFIQKTVSNIIITSFKEQYGINHMTRLLHTRSYNDNIDAHGMTVHALTDIMMKSLCIDKANTIKIMTGHGSGALKSVLKDWIYSNAEKCAIIGMIEQKQNATFIIAKSKKL